MKILSGKIIWMLAAVVLAVGPATMVFAISAPDSDIVLSNVQGYTGMLEDDDLLVIAKYDIPYATLPTESATDAYVGRFLRDGTDLNSTELFHFNDKGYNTGLISFYWTAAQRSTDSVEHGNANNENYQVRINGKPGVFPGAVPTQTTNTITWESKLVFKQNIIDLALEFDRDVDWLANSQDLITPGDQTLFTDDGAEYFATVIPRLATMESSLFTSAVKPLESATQVPVESLVDTLDDYWDGTPLGDQMDRIAGTQGVEVIVIRSIIAMFIMLLIAFMMGFFLSSIGAPKAPEFGLMTLTVTSPLAASVNFLAMPVVIIMALMGVGGIAWGIWGHKS